jgi:hypothetical protein
MRKILTSAKWIVSALNNGTGFEMVLELETRAFDIQAVEP